MNSTSPPSLQELFPPTKTLKGHPYQMKHIYERSRDYGYLTEKEFIEMMVKNGYKYSEKKNMLYAKITKQAMKNDCNAYRGCGGKKEE